MFCSPWDKLPQQSFRPSVTLVAHPPQFRSSNDGFGCGSDAASPAMLQSKLIAILQNPQALPSREQCRAYAAKHFSWDRPVAGFEQTFSELCGAGGGA